MSDTRKKPSQLNDFEGDLQGSEIIQVTKPNVGTYKATTEKLREYFKDTPILLTQEEFDALETKDENRTYYIYEEE